MTKSFEQSLFRTYLPKACAFFFIGKLLFFKRNNKFKLQIQVYFILKCYLALMNDHTV